MGKESNEPQLSGEPGDVVKVAQCREKSRVSVVADMGEIFEHGVRNALRNSKPHCPADFMGILDNLKKSLAEHGFSRNDLWNNLPSVVAIAQGPAVDEVFGGVPPVLLGDEAVDSLLAVIGGDFDDEYFVRRMKSVLPPEMTKILFGEVWLIREYYNRLKQDIAQETKNERQMAAKIAALEAELRERGVDVIGTPASMDQAAGLMDVEDNPGRVFDLQNFWSELQKKLPHALYKKLVRDMQIMKAHVEKAERELLRLRQSIKGHEERMAKL